jgi:hypothetical protein
MTPKEVSSCFASDEQFSPCTSANKNVVPFYKQLKSQKATQFHGMIYAKE